MIDPALFLAAVGAVSGAAAAVLGVAQLTCEHAESRWTPRASTVLLASVAGWTGIDSWDFLAGAGPPVDGKAVAFVAALALSWAHRRAFGLRTADRQKRAEG